MSSSALEHLSPAFPQRAAWGTASSLRAWQQEALDQYERDQPKDFLCVATPGAGKTTFALRVALTLLQTRQVRRIVVVTPTEHLKVQWADAAARVGIQLDPGLGGRFPVGQGRLIEGFGLDLVGVEHDAIAVEDLGGVVGDRMPHAST